MSKADSIKRIPQEIIDSQEWRQLDTDSKEVLIDLTRQLSYNHGRTNNGKLSKARHHFRWRNANASSTINKALEELEAQSYVMATEDGYAVAWLPLWNAKKEPRADAGEQEEQQQDDQAGEQKDAGPTIHEFGY